MTWAAHLGATNVWGVRKQQKALRNDVVNQITEISGSFSFFVIWWWITSKNYKRSHFLQGSLNYPFWGDQTNQIYGNFEGFPLNYIIILHCFGWCHIMTPALTAPQKIHQKSRRRKFTKVFIIQDFDHAPKVILGASTAVTWRSNSGKSHQQFSVQSLVWKCFPKWPTNSGLYSYCNLPNIITQLRAKNDSLPWAFFS